MTTHSNNNMDEPSEGQGAYGSPLPIGLSDEDIRELARNVQHDRFQDLGVQLGFTFAELQTLENEYKLDIYRASVEMLTRWRTKQPPESVTKETVRRLLTTPAPQKPPVWTEETDSGHDNTTKMPKTEFSAMKEDEDDDYDDQVASWDGRRIYKNLILVSCAFLFVFTAFQALSNLQSSINCDAGLGLASLSTIYATLIVSAMLVPSFMIRHLGLKWTLAVSMVCYALYTVANYYPSWATLIPASVILGLAAAPLWTAKSTYLTTIAGAYAKLSGETVPSIVSRFWGIFFFFFQSSQILGNLISSLVLKQETSLNGTEGYQCGAQDCYTETGDENSTSYCDPPEKSLTYTLLSIYLASGIVAILIVAFLVDNLRASRRIQNQGTFDLCLATIRLMKDYKVLLIIPLTIYSGLEQAFITGDFTKSYVTCTLSVGWVGYVMICYGVADAIFSVIFGRLVKYTGQIPLFCFGALTNVCLVTALFLWEPKRSELPVFFVIAALWGVADAVWQTQLNALYGILFHDQQEPAYSNYRLWESVGFTMAFAYSNFLCVWIKLTILVCVLVVAMLGYAAVEIMVRRKRAASFNM